MPTHSATPDDLYHAGASAARSRAPRRRNPGGTVAAAVAALLALSSLAIGARGAIVALIPALGPAFAASGLPAAPQGAVLEKVSSSLSDVGGASVLAVEGEIANPSRVTVALGKLRVAIAGPDGREIYHWTTPAPKPQLAPGERISFRARLAAPPSEARGVSLRFARPGDDAWMPAR